MCKHNKDEQHKTLFLLMLDEHKWYMSETVGYDVGYHYALHNLSKKMNDDKFYIMYLRDMNLIEHECDKYCNNDCLGVDVCPIPKNTINYIIKNLEE